MPTLQTYFSHILSKLKRTRNQMKSDLFVLNWKSSYDVMLLMYQRRQQRSRAWTLEKNRLIIIILQCYTEHKKIFLHIPGLKITQIKIPRNCWRRCHIYIVLVPFDWTRALSPVRFWSVHNSMNLFCITSINNMATDHGNYNNVRLKAIFKNMFLHIPGLKITQIKIPRNCWRRCHINNMTSYEDFQFKT
jgi:hypothetical protein